ncbi:MAG: hypothetical protein KatS3mg111_1741 [Pirellulaceae bacterium]|nr:MAG: hypothetical protein KatS3mg111_1741 [Pirellulaceae bacterium]
MKDASGGSVLHVVCQISLGLARCLASPLRS